MRKDLRGFVNGLLGRKLRTRSAPPSARSARVELLEDRALLCACHSCVDADELVVSSAYCTPIEVEDASDVVALDELLDPEASELMESASDVVDSLLIEAGQDPNALTEEFVFSLNSLPGSNYTIYLDFKGLTLTGDNWNNYCKLDEIEVKPYSLDDDLSTFNNRELRNIYEIWLRVTEDYLPFNVNVTTEEPPADALMKSGSSDDVYGIRCCIGGSYSDWYGKAAGGVSFIGSFKFSLDTPNFVFARNLGSVKSVAEAASHEVGHTFGLRHDGTYTAEYYKGANGWAPIMGSAYYQPLTQWSKGEYLNANRQEDDLAIMTSGKYGMTYRDDDYGDTFDDAEEIELLTGVVAKGLIERNTDFDFFSFEIADEEGLTLTIGGYDQITNLDTLVSIYDADRNLVETFDPADSLSVAADLSDYAPGRYYLSVTGTGLTVGSTVYYSDYASLGAYSIKADFTSPALAPPTEIVVVENMPTFVSARWDAVRHAAGYEIALYNADRSKKLLSAASSTNSYVLTGLEPGASYILEIASRGTNGELSAYASTTISTPYTAPKLDAPTGLVCTNTATTAEVKWNTVEGANSYHFILCDSAGNELVSAKYDSVNVKIAELAPETTYLVYISASGISALTSDSVRVEFTTSAQKKLAKPQPAAGSGEDSIFLSWNSVSHAVKYYVEFKEKGAEKYEGVYVDSTQYALTGLSENTEYEIRVRAIGDGDLWLNSDRAVLEAATTPALKIDLMIPTIDAANYDDTPVALYTYAGETAGAKILVDGKETDALVLRDNAVYYLDGLRGEIQATIVLTDGTREVAAESFTFNVVTTRLADVEGLVVDRVLAARAEISWDPVPNAQTYDVYVYNADGSLASSQTVSEPSATLQGLTNSTDYRVEVAAKAYRYDPSLPAGAEFVTIEPKKTVIPVVEATGGETSIALSWTPDDCAKEYRVEYKAVGEDAYTTIYTTETNFTIEGLKPSTSYNVRVKTISGDDCYLNSDFRILTVKTTDTISAGSPDTSGDVPTVRMVMPVVKAAAGTDSIALTWNANSSADSYLVEYRVSGVGKYIRTTTRETSWVFEGLDSGTTYEIRVKGVSGDPSVLNSYYRVLLITTD